MEVYVGAGALLFIWLVVFTLGRHKSAIKRKLFEKGLSDDHLQILRQNFPISFKLTDDQQKKLHGLINLFIYEKEFTGCNGLKMTDEIKVTIAAQACLLLLNNKTQPWYKKLHTVLVYPSAYKAVNIDHEDGIVTEEEDVMLGESWAGCSIVLSWNHSLKGGVNFEDGQNVVLHEFAHQLDENADGIPLMETASCYTSWAKVLSKNYKKLVKKTMKNQETLLDKYGATNEAEFFSVATECFFEKPRQMKKKHPDLYAELSKYYGLNPVDWD